MFFYHNREIVMNWYKFFLLIVCAQVSFFDDLNAMDSVHEQDNCVVDMASYVHNDYRQSISDVGRCDLKAMRLNLEKDIFLPPSISVINHLLYLSTIQKDNTKKTLFTQNQQKKFDAALEIQRWVPRCFVINSGIIMLTASFPFTASIALLQCANATAVDCLSQTSVIFTPAAIATAGALAVGFSSLYATGISPDLSSRKADKVQDDIGSLHDDYLTVAKYWVDLYFDCPEKAEYIANLFDIDELKNRVALKTYKVKLANKIINPLEEAWCFIKNKQVLTTLTIIELYIYNKIIGKRIDFIEKNYSQKNALIKYN